jgi:hypothetical protein
LKSKTAPLFALSLDGLMLAAQYTPYPGLLTGRGG